MRRFRNIAVSLLVALPVLVAVSCVQPEQVPPTLTLSEQELVDLLVGSCIQATRGCGSERYIRRAKQALA